MAQDRVRAFVHGAQQLTRGPDHQAGIEARFPGHLTRRAQNGTTQFDDFLRVRIRDGCTGVYRLQAKAGASERNPRTAALARATQGCLQMQSPPLGSVETRSHHALPKEAQKSRHLWLQII